ncbi:MAG: hypothetical protein ACXACF_01525 [Candidatus Hermodarchaeia archaeon]|jgi:hypothetical protein
MKYEDSYRKVFTFTATGDTQYSDWINVGWANEVYGYLTFSETGTANSETIDAEVERHQPFVTESSTTVLAWTQINAAGTEEIYMRSHYDGGATAADNKIGNRIRLKVVSGGTFGSGNTITITITLNMKRV